MAIFSALNFVDPISRDTDINAAMCNCWWTNKGAINERYFVFVHQHSGDDVT